MKCADCNSTNVRASSWKRSDLDASRFIYSPHRCNDCGKRFIKVSAGFKGTLAIGVGVAAFFAFIITMYVWSQQAGYVEPASIVPEQDTQLLARARKGDAEAQYRLGLGYRDGDRLTLSYTEALKWFESAAKQGHAGAQLNLGLMYKWGRGTLQDYAEAAKWFAKAATQGHAEAQYHLGTFYKVGQGVEYDTEASLCLV